MMVKERGALLNLQRGLPLEMCFKQANADGRMKRRDKRRAQSSVKLLEQCRFFRIRWRSHTD